LVPFFWVVFALAIVAGCILAFLFSTGQAATAGLMIAGLLGLWIFAELAAGIVLYTFAEFSVLHPEGLNRQRRT
jgi:hypothetical protein